MDTQTAIFISKALEVLPQNNIISSIRSHMYHTAREMPCKNFNEIIRYKRCETCGFALKDLTHVFNLEPTKKVSRFLRRLKVKANFNTKYQNLSLKKVDKKSERQQILALKCNICNTLVKQNIQKPHLKNIRKNQQQPVSATMTLSKKKSKKKKKDRFSGLNKLFVNNLKRPLDNNNITNVPTKLPTELETINLVTPDRSIINILDISDKTTVSSPGSLNKTLQIMEEKGAPNNPSTPKNSSIINISDMLTPVYLNKKNWQNEDYTNKTKMTTEAKETKLKKHKKLLKTVTPIISTSNRQEVENKLETPKSKSQSTPNINKQMPVLHSSKKKKKNKNKILVSDKNEKEKKQKKLNSLSNLLQKRSGNVKSTTSSLQDFLSSMQ